MKSELHEMLKELTDLNGPPGFEGPVVAYLADQFKHLGTNVEVDPMGNLYAEIGDPEAKPHLMVSAHSDEIGAIVRHIDQRGFLRIDPMGGVSPVLLVGRRVRVGDFLGVIGTRPGHLLSPEERRLAPPVEALYVDLGVDSADEVRALGIDVGTPITYDSPLQSLANPDRLSGKSIDNRLGCAVLLQLFKTLQGRSIAGRVTGVVAVQEEVGLRGATVAARRVSPDYAVVVDTFPVGDTPDVTLGRMPGAIGKGPVLVITAQGRSAGHISHPRIAGWLRQAAASLDIPLQSATSVGYAVTDAASVHLRKCGIPTCVLGLPRRYSHSPVCTFDINDAVDAVRVLELFVMDMATHDNLNFLSTDV